MVKNLVPVVSVIIPTYNRGHIVDQAIYSVLRQTCQDFEIIVVDDASTDNTEELIKGFSDPRIHYLRQQRNRGAPYARNLGAEVAQGKYLAFLDSDDLWFPELLKSQLTVLANCPPNVGMICCGMVRKQGQTYRTFLPTRRSLTFDGILIFSDGLCASSFLIRKTAFQAVGGFDVMYSSFQDFDFLLRVAAKYQIDAVDDILLEYRLGDDSISRNMIAKAKGLEQIIKTYSSDILRLGVMHRYLFRLGQYYVLSGNLQLGRRCWARALRYKFLDIKIWKHLLLTIVGVRLYRRVLLLHNRRIEQKQTVS